LFDLVLLVRSVRGYGQSAGCDVHIGEGNTLFPSFRVRSLPNPADASSIPKRFAASLISCAALLTNACGAHYLRSDPPAATALPSSALTRHVLLVSIDGLRPDAIATFNAPALQRLMREGSYTLSARTITPSKTLPSHTSMLTGEPPERHQVTWNNVITARRDSIDVPNVFSVARARGYRTAAFFSKAKFEPLQRPGTLDYSQAPGGLFGRWSSARTVGDVDRYLAGGARPNLLFVHLTDPDASGHRSGWMSPQYGRAVLAADTAVDRLVQLADRAYGAGQYTVIVTADHGGHGTNHGSDDPLDATIPWMAWGQGVHPGTLASTVSTMDTASTVLWLLGLSAPSDWAGVAIQQAFLPPQGGTDSVATSSR
jgi:arylsulfatase A-like enzyme